MKFIKLSKSITITIVLFLSIIGSIFLPLPTTYADDICSHLPNGSEVWKANGCDPGVNASNDLSTVITKVINGVIGVLSIAIAIMIIVGGINYITAAGDASKIEKAKKTILYAVIGAIICVLAFAITNLITTALKSAG